MNSSPGAGLFPAFFIARWCTAAIEILAGWRSGNRGELQLRSWTASSVSLPIRSVR
jgi:hypothetical protein